MNRLAKTAMKMLCLSALLFTSNIFAACYDKSPSFKALGEEYYNLEEPLTLSNEEQNQVKSLFKQLRGKWSGKGTHIDCLGPDSAPREKVSRLKLRVKMESKNTMHVAFNSEIKNLESGVTRKEKIDILGKIPVFTFVILGPNHIKFTEKYRSASGVVKQNKKRFTRLVENIYELNKMGEKLHFVKRYYINGIYVGTDEWHLSPGL
jgi:hypothetical protein